MKERAFSFLCEYSTDITHAEMKCSQPQVSVWQYYILAVVLTASFCTSTILLSHLCECICVCVFHRGRRRKITHPFDYLHTLPCRFLLPDIFNWPAVNISDIMVPETSVMPALMFFSVLTKAVHWFHRKIYLERKIIFLTEQFLITVYRICKSLSWLAAVVHLFWQYLVLDYPSHLPASECLALQQTSTRSWKRLHFYQSKRIYTKKAN